MLKVLEVEGAVERDGVDWQRHAAPWQYDRGSSRARHGAAPRRAGRHGRVRDARLRAGWRSCARARRPAGRAVRSVRQLHRAASDADLRPSSRGGRAAYLRRSDVVDRAAEAVAGRCGGVRDDPARTSGSSQAGPQRLRRRRLGRTWCGVGSTKAPLPRRAGRRRRRARSDGGGPEPAPTWLTYVPSTSSARAGARLRRPGWPTPAAPAASTLVERVRAGPPQKEMAEQRAAVPQRLGRVLRQRSRPRRPGCSLDDIVDSRWTLTVVGAALRESGSGPMYPFALAQALSS